VAINDLYFLEIKYLRPPTAPSIGYSARGTVSISYFRQNLDIIFEICNAAESEAFLHLSYIAPQTSAEMDYKISLDHTRAYFGGYRTWFVCPVTGNRAAKLYLDPQNERFVSHRAIDALYESQLNSDYDRALAMKNKVAAKLELCLSKPNGMHQKTYQKILDRYARYNKKCYSIITEKMQRFTALYNFKT
jgi:hypothetical protein